jgi:hypothetical protein
MANPTFRERNLSDIRDRKDWDPQNDGVDHLNIGIFRRGLGLASLLTNQSRRSPIDHPYLGHFSTMESYWTYLQYDNAPESIREMHGATLQGVIKKLGGKKVRRRYFRDLIMDGNFYRIQQSSAIKRAFIESELPFANYYLHGDSNVPIYPTVSGWLVQDLHELREIFKRGLEFEYVPVPEALANERL